MFYVTKKQFEVNQPIADLNDRLKKTLVGTYVIKQNNFFSSEIAYSGELNYDKFVLFRSAKPFEKLRIVPDAHIKLVQVSENRTMVHVKIKFSEIWYLLLVFLHLSIICGILFFPHLSVFNYPIEGIWWQRILLLIGVLIPIHLLIWCWYRIQVNRFKIIIPGFLS